jgi:hypothetical protein
MAWRIYRRKLAASAGSWPLAYASSCSGEMLVAGGRNKRLAAIANQQCGENGGMASMANQWRKWRIEEYHIGMA